MNLRHLVTGAIVSVLAVCSAGCSKRQVEDSYHFNYNGCDTQKQIFKGKDAEDVKKQMCAALQNESLNRGCAYELRKRHFEQNCSGHTWNPSHNWIDEGDADSADFLPEYDEDTGI